MNTATVAIAGNALTAQEQEQLTAQIVAVIAANLIDVPVTVTWS